MKHARARHTATLLKTGNVLIAGGVSDTLTELYDPSTDTWFGSGNMATRRFDHVAVRLLDGTVLLAGGRTKNDMHDTQSITNSAEIYDPKTNTWASLPNMHFARADFTAALLPDGSIMVIGGRLQSGDLTQTT